MKIYDYNGRTNVIGPNVKKYREKLGMTQKDLAEEAQRCGCTIERVTILRIEKGDRFVSDYEVYTLAKALKVQLEDLYKNQMTDIAP